MPQEPMNGDMPTDGGMEGNMPMGGPEENGPMGPEAMEGEDPNMMNGDMGMQGPEQMGGNEAEPSDDSTMGIINQLSDEDREAVRAYAASMLEKENGTRPEEQPQQMQEGVKFTKKQIKNIHNRLQ